MSQMSHAEKMEQFIQDSLLLMEIEYKSAEKKDSQIKHKPPVKEFCVSVPLELCEFSESGYRSIAEYFNDKKQTEIRERDRLKIIDQIGQMELGSHLDY